MLMLCLPCRTRRHGPACDGCDCPCGVLGYRGPFEFGDPTVITWDVLDDDD